MAVPHLPPKLAFAGRRNDENPIARLGQTDNIQEIDELGCGEWTVLYESQGGEEGRRFFYSGLLPPARVSEALKRAGWDLLIGHGVPGFSQRHDEGVTVTTFDRFGMGGAEPILYVRDFHGIKPRQIELSEEFRLFHNFYHDRHNDRYIYVDERGEEIVAAEITPVRARVLTRLLRKYLAARQIALALFFDHNARADVDAEEAKAAFPPMNVAESDRCYSFGIGASMSSNGAFSRLVGKKIIPPPPVTECGVWPYDTMRRDQYAEFVIGVARDGLPVTHSCDPEALANYFGANEDSPHYLTPVWFTRDVLAKYYGDANKFSVEDGLIRCGSLWSIQIDNNLPNHVVVYLGDLGRDLAYEEQGYWRHFNVTPGDRQPSEVNFNRSIRAQFTDPSAPDLLFKQRYTQLNEVWTKTHGWPIFLTLHEADAHIFKQFRLPLSDDLGEFDTQLLYLVKLMVDSLNEQELARVCGGALADDKSINKLSRYLASQKYTNVNRDIQLLRILQELRSSGAVHRKGNNFDKIRDKVGLNRDHPRIVFRNLLFGVNETLNDLASQFTPPTG